MVTPITPKRPVLLLVEEIAEGALGDSEHARYVAAAFRSYLADDAVPLHRRLQVPCPGGLAQARRDAYLVEAASLVGGGTNHVRARLLLDALGRCQRSFVAWRQHGVPEYAPRLHALLFHAASAAALPATRQGIAKVLEHGGR